MYVIMKQSQRGIYKQPCKPHEVVKTKSFAKLRVKELNAKALFNDYWYVRVPFKQEIANSNE